MLEPCAGKLARTVLRGGKLVKAYLSQPQDFAKTKSICIKSDICPVPPIKLTKGE